MNILPIFIGIILGIIYGLLLHKQVQRSPRSAGAIYVNSLIATIARLVLFGIFAYMMLRYSLNHLILMLVAFLGSFWIVIIDKGRCICKALISFKKSFGNLLKNSE